MRDIEEILQITDPTILFPSKDKKAYRELQRETHPDLHPESPERAQMAFIHISKLWEDDFKYLSTYEYVPPKNNNQEIVPVAQFENKIFVHSFREVGSFCPEELWAQMRYEEYVKQGYKIKIYTAGRVQTHEGKEYNLSTANLFAVHIYKEA